MSTILRIAFGTDDNRTLKQERFGDSRQFRIVSMKDGTVVSSEIRVNPFAEPTLENKPPKILTLLNDCNIFIGRSWRTGSFTLFTENGKKVFIADIESLDDISNAVVRKDFSHLKVFDLIQQKFIPASQL